MKIKSKIEHLLKHPPDPTTTFNARITVRNINLKPLSIEVIYFLLIFSQHCIHYKCFHAVSLNKISFSLKNRTNDKLTAVVNKHWLPLETNIVLQVIFVGYCKDITVACVVGPT